MQENASHQSSMLNDIAEIEKSLTGDVGAEKAKAMIDYFDSVRRSGEAELASALSADDRDQIMKAMEAFEAAQRIIRSVWETIHTTAFPA